MPILSSCGPRVWLLRQAEGQEGEDEAEAAAQVQGGRSQRQGQVVQGRQGDQGQRSQVQ